jgi:pectinesterase
MNIFRNDALVRITFAQIAMAAMLLCHAQTFGAENSATHPSADAIVATDGSGKYKSVQDAINAAPQLTPADHSWTILIKPGVYKEHIYIQREKRFISLVGEDSDAAKAVLTYDLNANMKDRDGKIIGTFATPSTFIDADDFTCTNLTFENSAGNVGQALAIRIEGDRDTFRNCRFLGWQDTILGNRGRHYFQNCYILGAVDFIFGGATEFYDHCHIHCAGNGYITAASTPEAAAFGFVFSHCTITGNPEVKTYLGRPWRAFASATFLDTEMSDVVRPTGWDNWKQPDREKTARYSEYAGTGPGATVAARVNWSHQLSETQTTEITAAKVLAGNDGWNPSAN